MISRRFENGGLLHLKINNYKAMQHECMQLIDRYIKSAIYVDNLVKDEKIIVIFEIYFSM
jgi:hypothetical protein